jgi:transposase-like protein
MMTVAFKGSHFERDVILWGVRWYVAYPISYRQIEEMMGAYSSGVSRSAGCFSMADNRPAMR